MRSNRAVPAACGDAMKKDDAVGAVSGRKVDAGGSFGRVLYVDRARHPKSGARRYRLETMLRVDFLQQLVWP